MLNTRSAFYYGHIITDQNFNLDFDEGVGALTAVLASGSYSLTDFATELERALNSAGTQIYSVSIDRSTRRITIAAGSNFELLAATGPTVGSTAFTLAGFDAIDKTGTNSYESDNASGNSYIPQLYLQDYIDFEDNQISSGSSVSQSAAGLVQTSSFGVVKFMECNIIYVTDLELQAGGIIENNQNAVAELRAFMENIVQKPEIEFIPDRDTPSVFTKCLLESTQLDKQGTGFRLYEMSGKKLFKHFETKKLKFRKVN